MLTRSFCLEYLSLQSLNRIFMVGNATDSIGNTVRWNLEGRATIYDGTMVVSLTGSVGALNQNGMLPTQPTQDVVQP